MNSLILVRGPSGAGKSTIARFLATVHNIGFHETDQFFMDSSGVYHFNAAKLKNAHAWNGLQVERDMFHDTPIVIVANTFIKLWEMESYFMLAKQYNYEVSIIRTPDPWDPDTLFKRNEHSVPLDTIKRQINTYQPHEKETIWTDMSIFK